MVAGKFRHDAIGFKAMPRWIRLTVCGRLPSTGKAELATAWLWFVMVVFLSDRDNWE